MAFDPNISRWLLASCRAWFDSHRLNNATLFYEYTRHKQLENPTTGLVIQQYGEFRLNGPDHRKVTHNEEWYDIVINVLCTQDLNEGQSDEIDEFIGNIYVCFTECIPVYRYGDSSNLLNDNTYIGFLKRTDEKNGQVNLSRFGQANPDSLLTQVSIEASYRMKLQL